MDKPIFSENPNPNAKIAFVMWTPFDFYVLKNIAKYLPEAEFVICQSSFRKKTDDPLKDVSDSVALFTENVFFWRVHLYTKDVSIDTDFFSRYSALVALHSWRPLTYSFFNAWVVAKKTVLVSYGVGKDLVTAMPWAAQFDIALVEGGHTHALLKPLTHPIIVGVPKFDDWFTGSVVPKKVETAKAGLTPVRQKLLYLPTHGQISSLRTFLDEVLSLADTYDVAVKLHHFNTLTEVPYVEKIRSFSKILLYESKDDLLPLLQSADIVISDSSSAVFEVLLAEKPVVILDIVPETISEFNGFWHMANQYYRKSIEQQIKRDGLQIGEVVSKPGQLRSAVGRAVETSRHFVKNQKRLREYLFSFSDGTSGKRAASVINDFLYGKIVPERPVWGLAIRAYFFSKSEDLKNWLDEKKYKHDSNYI